MVLREKPFNPHLKQTKLKPNSATFEIAPDGTRLVTTHEGESEIYLWKVPEGCLVGCLKGHQERIFSAHFSADGQQILTLSQDGTARLWNGETGDFVLTFGSLEDPLAFATFAPIEAHLLLIFRSGRIEFWKNIEEEYVPLALEKEKVSRAFFSPTGRVFATQNRDGSIRLYLASGESIAHLGLDESPTKSALFSPQGSFFGTLHQDGTCQLYTENGAPKARFWLPKTRLQKALFSNSEDALLTYSYWDPNLWLWDLHSFENHHTLTGHYGEITSACFSPDQQRLLTSSEDHTAKLWESTTGKLIATLHGHSHWVYSAKFSPEGHHIVTLSRDGTALIWDGYSGEALTSLSEHRFGATLVSFSPDGTYLVSRDGSGQLFLWKK